MLNQSAVRASPSGAFWERKAVVVTGGAGFLGRPTVRLLEELGAEVRVIRSAEHDLRDQEACRRALDGAEVVIHLAARVGGIGFNRSHPGQLAHDNLTMGANVFEIARQLGVEKLVAASSACVYPQAATVPFHEDEIWLGYPEPTTAPYGLAKKMLSVLSEAYRSEYGLESCTPVITNMYGPGDDFDPENSHVVAAMIRKYVEAGQKGEGQVVLWGTGSPTREFLYVDDAARAMILAAEHYQSSRPINIGTGAEVRISELAERISDLAGYAGETVWDAGKPDGQARRCLDVGRARELIGFEPEIELETGLRRTIDYFRHGN